MATKIKQGLEVDKGFKLQATHGVIKGPKNMFKMTVRKETWLLILGQYRGGEQE